MKIYFLIFLILINKCVGFNDWICNGLKNNSIQYNITEKCLGQLNTVCRINELAWTSKFFSSITIIFEDFVLQKQNFGKTTFFSFSH